MKKFNYEQLKTYYKSPDTLSERLIIEPLSAPLAYILLKITQSRKLPYALTMMGFLFFSIGAILISFGFYLIGAIIIFNGAIIDNFDGVTARFIYGKDPAFRGYLDITVDSFSASIIILSLLSVFLANKMFIGVFLLLLYVIVMLIFWIQCSSTYRILSERKKDKLPPKIKEKTERSKRLKLLLKLVNITSRLTEKYRIIPHPTACDAAIIIYVVIPLLHFNFYIPIFVLGIIFIFFDISKATITNYVLIHRSGSDRV